jgi:hypothetical protein
MDTQNEPINKWIYGPAGRAVQLVAEEIVIAGLTERATISLVQLPQLLNFIRSESRHGILKNYKQLEKLHAMSLGDAEFAKKEVEAGFSNLHIHGLISLWSFVETCLDDTSLALIKKCKKEDVDREAVFFERATGLPVLGEQAAQRLRRKMFNSIKEKLNTNYMMTFEIFFKGFGIMLNNEQARIDKMQEINSLRNCVLHRSKVVDEYAVCMPPGLLFKVGDEITINHEQFGMYMSIISDYILNFHDTIAGCKYMAFISSR